MVNSEPQKVVLHPGSDIETTLHIRHDQQGGLFISSDLSRNQPVDGESRIDRGRYRAFTNAVHSAVYAVPKSGVRMKPSYAISTNDETGMVTCSIPAASAKEAEAVLTYLTVAPSRGIALAD